MRYLCLGGMICLLAACSIPAGEKAQPAGDIPQGKLFIIGGGKRPVAMVQEMIQLSGLEKGGYAVVLPMSSVEPDTAFYYARRQFAKEGIDSVYNLPLYKGENITDERLDSLVRARLIYIPGGEQVRFMEAVLGTPVIEALHRAYREGAVIAGTSAGAAVMSKKMITGNEFKHREYTGDFRTIEANNMELTAGLGLLEDAIVDQHFIWRMRNNRLIAVAIENPGHLCIGIDESTAIVVEGDSARVSGISQVVTIKNNAEHFNVKDGLLGADNLSLSVYLPGDIFPIR